MYGRRLYPLHMSQTKKITLSALMVALGTVFMVIGAVFEVLDLTVCAMASLLVVFIFIEVGSYYPWLVWICTSLATALMYPASLIFGIYPLIKSYIEKLPRWSWLIVKIAYINAMIWGLVAICELLLKSVFPFFEGIEGKFMLVVLYVLMNVAFIAYDLFITVMVNFYFIKLRPRFKKFLK